MSDMDGQTAAAKYNSKLDAEREKTQALAGEIEKLVTRIGTLTSQNANCIEELRIVRADAAKLQKLAEKHEADAKDWRGVADSLHKLCIRASK